MTTQSADASAASRQPVWIGGAWVQARAPQIRECLNAATLAPLGAVPECGVLDLAAALDAAAAAQAAWRATPAALRMERLARVGARLRSRATGIARSLTQEFGKPLCESLDEIAAAAACFGSFAEREVTAAAPLPAGIDGILGSGDLPISGTADLVAAALAAGRCVVCVTSPQTPMTGLLLAECFDALPAGVVNVLTGGAELAAALMAHFAGEGGGGTGGAEWSGGRGTRGAVPAIVLSDADLDLAVPGVAWLALRNAGQTYSARAQLYVDRGIAPAFADRLHEYLAFLEVGDPLKPDTDLGPLHSHEAVRRAEEQVARASKDGARIKLGGRAFSPWGLPGHFFQPTLLFDVRRDSLAAREEILAPVVAIMPVDGLDDAVDRTRALACVGAEIHTRDATLAAQALRSIRLSESPSGAPASLPALVHVTARQSAWFPYSARERRAG